jgi:hypothetical protein
MSHPRGVAHDVTEVFELSSGGHRISSPFGPLDGRQVSRV